MLQDGDALMYALNTQTGKRRGFTLIELLVAISIIAILAGLAMSVVGNSITGAREAATAATIAKIDGLLTERAEGYATYLKHPRNRAEINARIDALIQTLGTSYNAYGMTRKSVEILFRKDSFRQALPQRFEDTISLTTGGAPSIVAEIAAKNPDVTWGTVVDLTSFAASGNAQEDAELLDVDISSKGFSMPDEHHRRTESSELLYFVLTQMTVYGVPPTPPDSFSDQEVMDTDNDGLPEFVDAWGNPLRFYRWPTRLVRPGGNGQPLTVPGPGWPDDSTFPPIDRTFGTEMLASLPAQSGFRDVLAQDQDDIARSLQRDAARIPVMKFLFNEVLFHTGDTWSVPLIVSAGADEILGLHEPWYADIAIDIDLDGSADLSEDGDFDGDTSIGVLGTLAQPRNLNDVIDNLTNNAAAGEI